MPGATPNYGLPYALIGDQPHGPNQQQALAQAIDTVLAGTYKTERDNAIAAAIAALLSGKAGFATVATSQTTASLTYTDLATAGPSVTLTSAGTRALTVWRLVQGSSSGTAVSSVTISGATTVAADDSKGLIVNDTNRTSMGFWLHTITPGSNTFKLQYRVTAGTGTFLDRSLFVLAP